MSLVKEQATWVTDPAPTTGDKAACEFKIYPTPDVVEFCEKPAVAVLIAPCCGQTTNVCHTCLGKGPGLGYWLCLGCGTKTDCKWTPMSFGIRWL